jgi:enoyl-CoA hydratase/carnithine racemase
MAPKVLYEKRDAVAYVTLNRPEVKNAIDIEAHELLCDIWTDFRDDPQLRVAVITGTGDAFTAGADLKTHAPEWQTVGPMVGRERLEDGLCGITRGPLSRITKPIVAAINGWCVGHGVELALACDIRIASEKAQFGTFEVRRGMHPADGGIPRLVNTCGVGVALELLLTGEPISAQRAMTANMVSRVVPHDELMQATDDLVQRILRCDQAAIESAKERLRPRSRSPVVPHDELGSVNGPGLSQQVLHIGGRQPAQTMRSPIRQPLPSGTTMRSPSQAPVTTNWHDSRERSQ